MAEPANPLIIELPKAVRVTVGSEGPIVWVEIGGEVGENPFALRLVGSRETVGDLALDVLRGMKVEAASG